MTKLIVVVLLTLVLGMLVGFSTTVSFTDLLVELFLIILLFVIGIEIGRDAKVEKFKEVWRDGAVLCIGTIAGSLIAGVVLSFLLKLDLKLSASVALGMGWYSLTGPFLAKTIGSFAGALGFTSNFLREVMTIFLYPKLNDKKAAISIGGATTMDSTLPIISSFSNPQISLIAFVHGFIISAAVPLLLMLVTSL
ncbi:lysine exporter LysO family protein [Archaeoglobales archaeon]|nr:MAG: lysine exporter LysO family protein [Archaeoglobales archaeon]